MKSKFPINDCYFPVSTYKGDDVKFGSDKAIDGNVNTFSHTDVLSGGLLWWQVDLGQDMYIDSVSIVN